MKKFLTLTLSICLLLTLACKDKDDNTSTTTPGTTDDLPAVFQKFTDDVEVYVEGDFVVLKTTDIPNHPSPYFDQSDSRYEAYNGTNPDFRINPNRISEQDITFRIPLNPAEATNHAATPAGPMGIALNGIVFFNQYAAMQAPLTNEINSFDQYNAHPQLSGMYHYHIEPTYLTSTLGDDVLLGFLMDGFPVYGPKESGATVTNSDLDAYHGHAHATADYPDGIYHYHITNEDPYLNGDGFWGTAGTVSQ